MVIVLKRVSATMVALVLLLIMITFLMLPAQGSEIKLPIIMYHHISEKEDWLNDYTITPEEFESDIKYLLDNGYNTVSCEEVLSFYKEGKALPPNPVMITFDDGFESFYVYAMPLILEYNIKAVLAVVGETLDMFTAANDHTIDYSYLTWDELDEIIHSEHVEIANHTYHLHHLDKRERGCSALPGEDYPTYEARMKEDILSMQDLIHSHTGSNTKIFAYPFGCICEKAEKMLEVFNFDIAFTCSEYVNVLNENCNLRKLARFNRPHGVKSEIFFKKIK